MTEYQHNFLICSERSGSNLITKLMDSHPNVCGPSPTHLLRFFAPLEHKYGNLNSDDKWEIFVNDIFTFFNLKISHWDFTPTKEEILALEFRDLKSVFQYFYHSEAKLHSKSNLFIKENHAYRLFPYYLQNFPESKYVWLVRDPRDMALSWKNNQILRGEVIRSGKIWHEDQKNTLYIYSTLKKENKIILVHYESLLQNTISELKRICSFLNIPYSSQMLDFQASTSTRKNAESSSIWKNLNKGVIKDNSKKYLKGLVEDEIKFIDTLCKNEMQSLGYKTEPDNTSKKDFIQIQNDLSRVEKFTKEGYLSISEEERRKRKEWSKCIQLITKRFS